MKPLSSNNLQKTTAKLFGINVDSDTVNVASAKIKDAVAISINVPPPIPASQDQCALAKKLSINVKKDTMRVAFAKIADAIFEKNTDAVEKMSLKKGDKVRYRGKPDSAPIIVSTVKSNGRVYFTGMNCPNAWASTLLKIK